MQLFKTAFACPETNLMSTPNRDEEATQRWIAVWPSIVLALLDLSIDAKELSSSSWWKNLYITFYSYFIES